MENIHPFSITEAPPGTYCLLLSDFKDSDSVFTEHGYDGGGYGWAAVAKAYVHVHEPQLEEIVSFDPEASMFCAYSEDKAAIEKLATGLSHVMNHKEVLAELMKHVDPDDL